MRVRRTLRDESSKPTSCAAGPPRTGSDQKPSAAGPDETMKYTSVPSGEKYGEEESICGSNRLTTSPVFDTITNSDLASQTRLLLSGAQSDQAQENSCQSNRITPRIFNSLPRNNPNSGGVISLRATGVEDYAQTIRRPCSVFVNAGKVHGQAWVPTVGRHRKYCITAALISSSRSGIGANMTSGGSCQQGSPVEPRPLERSAQQCRPG